MLTVQGANFFGLADDYSVCGPGLGVYTSPADFACFQVAGNYICKPRRAAVKGIYEELQRTVRTIAVRMVAAGRLALPRMTTLAVDGVIGKITALGVEAIGAAFTAVVKPDAVVAYALDSSVTAEEMVRRVAARAQEIDAWFKYVAENFPEAVVPDPKIVKEIQEKIVEKIVIKEVVKTPIERFRPIGAIVIGAAMIGLVGLAAAAIVTQSRSRRIRPDDF